MSRFERVVALVVAFASGMVFQNAVNASDLLIGTAALVVLSYGFYALVYETWLAVQSFRRWRASKSVQETEQETDVS